MGYPELMELAALRDKWVAVQPRGSRVVVPTLAELSSGASVVDYDEELDELCRRIADRAQTSLTIVYCGRRPRA